jgi:hypothetical protein
MIKYIESKATRTNIIILLAITIVVYVYMLLVSLPYVMSFAGGMRLFDLMPTGYSPEYAVNLLGTLGADGRHAYLTRQLPFDMFYPGLFAISYAMLSAFILKNIFISPNKFRYLVLLPIFAGLFDYLENIGIISMLVVYPDFSRTMALVSSVCTIMKSLLTTIFFLLLGIGIIAAVTRRFRNVAPK